MTAEEEVTIKELEERIAVLENNVDVLKDCIVLFAKGVQKSGLDIGQIAKNMNLDMPQILNSLGVDSTTLATSLIKKFLL